MFSLRREERDEHSPFHTSTDTGAHLQQQWKEQNAAIDRMLQKQRLDAIVSPEGCPIDVLPVLNLALVCRCLDSADLLSVYKSSRTLQSAASHPLTFQHGNRFTVDPWREGVRCEGPSAVVSSKAALQSALQSRRFASFRLLTLQGASEEGLESMLQLMTDASAGTAPVLHALTLRWADEHCDLSRMWPVVSEAPAFAYLRVLSIACSSLVATHGAALPPRLELLQLQVKQSSNSARAVVEQQQQNSLALLPTDLASLLAPLAQLRQLVVRDVTFNLASAPKTVATGAALKERMADAATRPLRTHWADLMTLAAIEAAAPQIDSIVWMIEVSYNEIVSAMSEFSKQQPDAAWPTLTRVRTLQLRRAAGPKESDLAPNPLLLFPSLTELRYTHQATNQATAGRYQGLMLNQLCAAQLSSLTHLTLTEAGPSPFDRVAGWTAPHGFDLAPLLRSLPHLTSLSVARLRIDSLSVFRFAPKLRTLRDLFWPVPHELVKAEEMAACFPSLTELTARAVGLSNEEGMSRQSRGDYARLHPFALRSVLCAMPRLLRVSINAAPLVRPDAILSAAEEDALQQQQAAELSRLTSQAQTQQPEDAEADRSAYRQRCSGGGTVLDLPPTRPSALSTAAATTGGSTRLTAAEDTNNRSADPAANLLFAFAAGAGVKSAASAGTATAAPANAFIFTPPSNLAAPTDAAPAFSFGLAAAAQSNSFAAPFSFAPVAVAPGGPSIASAATVADLTPLSFATWTSAAAASTAAAPTLSFAPAAFASAPAAPPAASPASAPALSPVFAFSAASSVFATAVPSAAANPFSSPFVFAAPAGSPFAAAEPAGPPDLAGFNPFAATPSSFSSSSSSPSSSASASSNLPSRR